MTNIDKIKLILSLIVFVVLVPAIIAITLYRFEHPEKTETELFIKFMQYYNIDINDNTKPLKG